GSTKPTARRPDELRARHVWVCPTRRAEVDVNAIAVLLTYHEIGGAVAVEVGRRVDGESPLAARRGGRWRIQNQREKLRVYGARGGNDGPSISGCVKGSHREQVAFFHGEIVDYRRACGAGNVRSLN